MLFRMMIGVPASGKSTVAKEYAKMENTVILSSDSIRKELYGDESIQGNGKQVFDLLHERLRNAIVNNVNVIYDACNVSHKSRKQVLSILAEYDNVYKTCTVCKIPLLQCLENNKKRERQVPEDVIVKMDINYQCPSTLEGWDCITIYDGECFRDL